MGKPVPQEVMDQFLDALNTHRELRLWESWDALEAAVKLVQKHNPAFNFVNLEAEKPNVMRLTTAGALAESAPQQTDGTAYLIKECQGKWNWLNSWEKEFVTSVEQQYKRWKRVTPKQLSKLAQIVRNHTR